MQSLSRAKRMRKTDAPRSQTSQHAANFNMDMMSFTQYTPLATSPRGRTLGRKFAKTSPADAGPTKIPHGRRRALTLPQSSGNARQSGNATHKSSSNYTPLYSTFSRQLSCPPSASLTQPEETNDQSQSLRLRGLNQLIPHTTTFQ